MSIAFKAIVVLLCAAVLSPSSWAQDRNGNWWRALPERDRPIYMIGVFDGIEFELNRVELELTGLLKALTYPQPCDDACVKLRIDQSFTNWKALKQRNNDFTGLTASQLVAGFDAMYADYRNRTIAVTDLLEVVLWSIRGVKQDTIDGRLTYLRSQK